MDDKEVPDNLQDSVLVLMYLLVLYSRNEKCGIGYWRFLILNTQVYLPLQVVFVLSSTIVFKLLKRKKKEVTFKSL